MKRLIGIGIFLVLLVPVLVLAQQSQQGQIQPEPQQQWQQQQPQIPKTPQMRQRMHQKMHQPQQGQVQPEQQQPQQPQMQQRTQPQQSKICSINKQTTGVASLEIVKEVTRAWIASKKTGNEDEFNRKAKQYYSQGQAITLNVGDEVKVIQVQVLTEFNDTTAQIEFKGKTWWIANDDLNCGSYNQQRQQPQQQQRMQPWQPKPGEKDWRKERVQ